MVINKRNLKSFALLSMFFLWQGAAFAVTDDNGGSPESIAENSPSSAKVYSGGVGDDEIQYIKTIQHQYDAKMLFTEANGMYLSDLKVTIRDRHGKAVVNTDTKGPILLVNLPAGSYTVVATQNGESRQQKIAIAGHGLHTYQFRFPTMDTISSEKY